jgi:hypothetical protein
MLVKTDAGATLQKPGFLKKPGFLTTVPVGSAVERYSLLANAKSGAEG